MTTKELIEQWFELWQTGDFLNLPISEDFEHTSPFGTISGKQAYLDVVTENKDKFLGYNFEIHDGIYEDDKACVRYTGIQGDFRLDVSEWYYLSNGQIDKIVAYYHIGDIKRERQIDDYDAS